MGVAAGPVAGGGGGGASVVVGPRPTAARPGNFGAGRRMAAAAGASRTPPNSSCVCESVCMSARWVVFAYV